MSEDETKRKQEVLDAKGVAFYDQAVSAWFQSAMERDKSLLPLSVAGIGFLISVMPQAIDSVASLLLFLIAIFAFLICIISVLFIFAWNKKHIEEVIAETSSKSKSLGVLDGVALYSFISAMSFSAILGVSSVITTYVKKGGVL